MKLNLTSGRNFSMDDVACQGSEGAIQDCEYVDEREREEFCEEVQELVGSDS